MYSGDLVVRPTRSEVPFFSSCLPDCGPSTRCSRSSDGTSEAACAMAVWRAEIDRGCGRNAALTGVKGVAQPT